MTERRMHEREIRDWTAVRRRLEAVERALRSESEPTREELDRIYRKRAEELARPLAQIADGAPAHLLVFRAGATRFGIPLTSLAEVIPNPKLARVPAAPPEVAGLVQVRGEVRPVWNLQVVFGWESPGDNAAERSAGQILLLRHGAQEIGVCADEIEDIVPYDPQKLRSAGNQPGISTTDDHVTVFDAKTLFERFPNPTTL